MSLDDFFNKKSKKKTRKINTNDLYEKIIDTTPNPKPETDKVKEDLLPKESNANDEWEPMEISNVPDFEELIKNDLAIEEQDIESDASSKNKDSSKTHSNKFTWEAKPKAEETKKNKNQEPEKPRPYVPGAFRNAKVLPNVDSLDEFPTLDAVKDKPVKKVEVKESPDNTWTQVTRGPSKRKEEQSTYVPPFNRSGPKYVPPSVRDNSAFPTRNAVPSDRPSINNQPATSGPWVRGNTIKTGDVNRAPPANTQRFGGSEQKAGLTPTTRAYLPPALRRPAAVTQSNRFAQLEDS